MHACGHDLHMTVLRARRVSWRSAKANGANAGPSASRRGSGAGGIRLLADHLYERFGRPDSSFRTRLNDVAAGSIAMKGGLCWPAHHNQRGFARHRGHGSAPSRQGPIILAAEFVLVRRPSSAASRSATAAVLIRGHHPRRHQEQHHSDEVTLAHSAPLLARVRDQCGRRRPHRKRMAEAYGFPPTAAAVTRARHAGHLRDRPWRSLRSPLAPPGQGPRYGGSRLERELGLFSLRDRFRRDVLAGAADPALLRTAAIGVPLPLTRPVCAGYSPASPPE